MSRHEQFSGVGKWVLRQLQVWHRWLAIVLSLPILLWFLSGAVMIYVPFPRLTEVERRAGLPALDLSAVRKTPSQALPAAGLDSPPQALRLGMLGERPVWRSRTGRSDWKVVGADDGQLQEAVTRQQAMAVARDFLARSSGTQPWLPVHEGLIDVDQWTLNYPSALRAPLHRLRFDDAAGTVLYVSSITGEVVRDTTRSERGWSWVGAVVHWIYPTPLRSRQPLWSQLVLWLSGVSLFVAVTGLVLGTWRSVQAWRRSRRISSYRGIDYWHHLLGWAAGLLVLAWLFSGWMSMGPFDSAPNAAIPKWRDAWSAGPAQWPPALQSPASVVADADDLVEAELLWIAGEPWYRLLRRSGAISWQAAVEGLPVQPDMEAALQRASGIAGIAPARRETLSKHDFHYSQGAHRDARPLPVWRLQLDDPSQTWLYVAPGTGELAGMSDRASRLDRWLYSALHSWDFPWLLQRPALRKTLMLAALLLGTALILTGIIIGCRRLRVMGVFGRPG